MRLIKWTLSLFGFAYAAVVVVYVAESANNQGVFDKPKRTIKPFCDGLVEIARSLSVGGYAS